MACGRALGNLCRWNSGRRCYKSPQPLPRRSRWHVHGGATSNTPVEGRRVSLGCQLGHVLVELSAQPRRPRRRTCGAQVYPHGARYGTVPHLEGSKSGGVSGTLGAGVPHGAQRWARGARARPREVKLSAQPRQPRRRTGGAREHPHGARCTASWGSEATSQSSGQQTGTTSTVSGGVLLVVPGGASSNTPFSASPANWYY